MLKSFISRKRYLRRVSDEQGSALIVTLSVLVILVGLAVGLTQIAKGELMQIKYREGKVKAKYLALSGFAQAIEEIRLASKDGLSINKYLKEQSIEMQDGSFKYVLQDEERKLNINAINLKSVDILISLITLLGFDDEIAKTIAYSVIDWKDSDDLISDDVFGAEDKYYLGLEKKYKCKNFFFQNKEELLLVRGMTKEIYNVVKEYITLYPENGRLRVNFDTASEIVLKSFAITEAKKIPNIDVSDVDSLIAKVLSYRQGNDGKDLSSDDRIVEQEEIPLNIKEKVLFLALIKYRVETPDFLRVNVSALEKKRKIMAQIDAVVFKRNLSVLFWNIN